MPNESEGQFLDELAESESKDSSALEQVMTQVHILVDLQKRIAVKEAELKDLEKQEFVMSRETIPTLLQSHGLDFLGLGNGKVLTVTDELAVGIPKDETKKKIVLNWIAAHGGSEIIKEAVTFEDPDEDIKAVLSERGFVFTEEKTVNTNSLKAWFRGALGMKKNSVARFDPKDVPEEANLFLYKQTKITEAKQ